MRHNLKGMQEYKETLDFNCSECEMQFREASSLLQHFALHVSGKMCNASKDKSMTAKKVPDLYPISFLKKLPRGDSDLESDSGVEDTNPIKFCLVTMAEDAVKMKKYECHYCSRKFGWPTDLKRHVLIHTGEKPFQCPSCDAAFTRNFLLKKHQRKFHNSEDSKSCQAVKNRKQDKCKIKRRIVDS